MSIDFTDYTTIKNKFTTTPNLCDLFKLLAIETWKRIEYAYIKPGIKVFETTLTQNLLFTINAYNDQYGLNIDISEARNEMVNGNDIELIIRYPAEGIEFYTPIQAKKVYKNGKYQSMDHGAQIESLRQYAFDRRAQPLYLLFNYTPYDTLGLRAPTALTGCTLISADYLFHNYYNQRVNRKGNPAWIIPRFEDMNPAPSTPWHQLVCTSNVVELLDVLFKAGVTPIDKLPKTTRSVVRYNGEFRTGIFPIGTYSADDNNWINIKQIPNIQSQERGLYEVPGVIFDEFDIQAEKKEKEYPVFAPKSRIVVTKN